ncbi:acyltransferase [Sphingobium sp. SYK-6]|uniref:acyltransferase family protein n=1 Tax=Sphingobium sp. (strain NBRC 103272 / SYK-6) TaxID=627192 RepID=UPI0002276F58|nr:acyltransferase family protein [Sphingobium sp. SYK-6]BAK66260.1 acyltransferase [Sphingobium sp. SYK-6]
MKYRKEIDGLRAIAVLAVVGYHAHLPGFASGYLGVDIFFVISGYLITGILTGDDRPTGQVLAAFYLRRVLRLLPALFAVLLATTLAAWFILLPLDFQDYGWSLAGASAFFANFVFWARSGYFESEAALNPLLHTWSLAVEEQFYIFFPLLFLFLKRRFPSLLLPVFVGSLLISLAAAELVVRFVPFGASHTFFLLPFRAWELLLGAVMALIGLRWTVPSRLGHSLLLTGLGLVLWAVFSPGIAGRTPNANLVLACAGTAMIILGGGRIQSAVKSVLAARPMVFFGKISYSLYLWHWPLLSFFVYVAMRAPSPGEAAILVLASILLAVLSWRFVEQPFRAGGFQTTPVTHAWRRNARIVAFVGLGIVALGCIIGLSAPGARMGQDAATRAHIARIDDPEEVGDCLNGVLATAAPPGGTCRFPAPGAGVRKTGPMLLLGDSHATDLIPPLRKIAAENAVDLEVFARLSCPPFLQDSAARNGRVNILCRHFLDNVSASLSGARFSTVVLSARWYGSVLDDMRRSPASDDKLRGSFLFHELSRTLDTLGPRADRIVVPMPRPEAQSEIAGCMGRSLRFGHPTSACLPQRGLGHPAWYQNTVRILQLATQGRTGVVLVDPTALLCEREGHCPAGDDEGGWYSDEDHLSTRGSLRLAPLFRQALH